MSIIIIKKDPTYYIKWQVVEVLIEWPYKRMLMRFKTKRSAVAYQRLVQGDRSAVGAFLSSYHKEHKELPTMAYEMGLRLHAAPWVGI